MRLLAFMAALLAGLTSTALATPPDMTCEINGTPISFTIHLTTNYSNLNRHGIVPLSLHHSSLSNEGSEFENPSLYTEDLVGQWLIDDRVDLHFYKEETPENGKTVSINLTIKTKSTDQQSDESGHMIHKGAYGLELYSGSKRENSGKLVKQFSGVVVCK